MTDNKMDWYFLGELLISCMGDEWTKQIIIVVYGGNTCTAEEAEKARQLWKKENGLEPGDPTIVETGIGNTVELMDVYPLGFQDYIHASAFRLDEIREEE